MIEKYRNLTWKVEDISTEDFCFLTQIVCKQDVSPIEAREALDTVSNTTNTYNRSVDLSPAHLGRFADQLIQYTEECGYVC